MQWTLQSSETTSLGHKEKVYKTFTKKKFPEPESAFHKTRILAVQECWIQNLKSSTLFKVRTAANRSAGFGDEQKSCKTEIAGDNSDEVVRGSRTMAEAAS